MSRIGNRKLARNLAVLVGAGLLYGLLQWLAPGVPAPLRGLYEITGLGLIGGLLLWGVWGLARRTLEDQASLAEGDPPVSKKVKAVLKAAGWTPGRRVDTTRYQDALTAEGYPLFPAWVQAMTQFGGLRMAYPNPRMPSHTTRTHLDPIRAANSISKEVIDYYAQRVGEPLAVIGAADNDYLTLMIGPSGKIYGGYDEFLCELGTELFDALDCLVSVRGAREIEE